MKPKLVRDNIRKIIEDDNGWCKTRYVKNIAEHISILREKIIEETDEFIEDPCYEEAGDMVEVIKAFCYLNGLEWDVVLSTSQNKQDTHGAFFSGLVLESLGQND
mgnify:CR=1 FL=1